MPLCHPSTCTSSELLGGDGGLMMILLTKEDCWSFSRFFPSVAFQEVYLLFFGAVLQNSPSMWPEVLP